MTKVDTGRLKGVMGGSKKRAGWYSERRAIEYKKLSAVGDSYTYVNLKSLNLHICKFKVPECIKWEIIKYLTTQKFVDLLYSIPLFVAY